MLRDLDLSIEAFLTTLLPAGITIRFDPPAASWAQAPPGAPLLDAFLYDIRQARRPAADGMLTRDQEGHATGWQPPARTYRVSYLLTAWTDGSPAGSPGPRPKGNPKGSTQGEHELLGSVLAGCATAQAIPPDCLHGALAEQGEPVLFACAAADRALEATQLWPGLGIQARTALDLMVLAPMVPELLTEVAPGVRSIEFGARRKPLPPAADGGPARPQSWPQRRITEE